MRMRENRILERGFELARCYYAHIEEPKKTLADEDRSPSDAHMHSLLARLRLRRIHQAQLELLD